MYQGEASRSPARAVAASAKGIKVACGASLLRPIILGFSQSWAGLDSAQEMIRQGHSNPRSAAIVLPLVK
jgi:hypothetical protein